MHGRKKVFAGLVIFVLCLVSRGNFALAQGEKEASGWEFRVVPYLWLTGMEADLEIPREDGPVTLSFGDMWTVQDYGGSVYLEAQKGRFSVIGDGIYLQDEFPSNPPGPPAVADVEQLTGELSLAYRPPFLGSVEVVAGALANSLKIDVAVEGEGGAAVDDSWVDPMLGLRWRYKAGPGVTFMLRGDVGGFGINDALGVRLMVEGDLYLTDRLYFLTAYRFGYLDYDPGDLKAEVLLNGVALGLGYQF